MAFEINTLNCESVNEGVGLDYCRGVIGQINRFFLMENGTVWDTSAVDLNNAFVIAEQAAERVEMFLKTNSHVIVNQDDTIATSETNINTTTLKGLNGGTFTFKNGVEFAKSLESFTSDGAYDIGFIDVNNNVIGTQTEGGFSGITVGELSALSFNFGAESTGTKSLTYQLTERAEYNKNLAVIYASQHDINFKLLDGTQQLRLEWFTLPVDGSATGVLDVKKKDGQNLSLTTTLTAANFPTTKNGAAETVTIVEDTVIKGRFTVTFGGGNLAADDEVSISVSPVAIGNKVYKSSPIEITVV